CLVLDDPLDVAWIGARGAPRGTQGMTRSIQGAFLGGVLDGHIGVERSPEIDRAGQEEEHDRQDQGEFDDALSAPRQLALAGDRSGSTGWRAVAEEEAPP